MPDRLTFTIIMSPELVRFLTHRQRQHELMDPNMVKGLTPGEYLVEGLTRAMYAHAAAEPDRCFIPIREQEPLLIKWLDEELARRKIMDGWPNAATITDVVLALVREEIASREHICTPTLTVQPGLSRIPDMAKPNHKPVQTDRTTMNLPVGLREEVNVVIGALKMLAAPGEEVPTDLTHYAVRAIREQMARDMSAFHVAGGKLPTKR